MGVLPLLDFPRFAMPRLPAGAGLLFTALREDCCSISISSSRLSSLGRAARTSWSMSCNQCMQLQGVVQHAGCNSLGYLDPARRWHYLP